ncbi:unnamed protein product, partial [Ectocarpus sp. 12 AP-2014]
MPATCVLSILPPAQRTREQPFKDRIQGRCGCARRVEEAAVSPPGEGQARRSMARD